MTREDADRFVRRLDAVVRQLELVVTNDEASITRQQGESVLRRLQSMRASVCQQTLPPRHQRYAHLSRMIMDSWPLGTKIGNAITELEAEYRKL